MITTNTPFEDGLDEAFKAYIYTDYYWDGEDENETTVIDEVELKAALLKLHKAAIVAELGKFSQAKCICNETDTATCDSYWHHTNAVEDRIEQYKKEEKDE